MNGVGRKQEMIKQEETNQYVRTLLMSPVMAKG